MEFSESLKKNKDFTLVYRRGVSKANRQLVMYIYHNNTDRNRIGISVSKKLGNAVFRNKYKRKIRAIIDSYKKNYNYGRDYIIILRKGAIEKSYDNLKEDYIQLI